MRYIITFLLACAAFVQAEIVEINQFKELESYVDDNSLILLDIDDTLLITEQMLGCDEWFLGRMKFYQDKGLDFNEALENTLPEYEAIRHLSKMKLVEPGTDEVIKHLQEEGYPIMGLTIQEQGLSKRTSFHLKSNNIDFRTSASHGDCFHSHLGHGIFFRNGVLFTSGQAKGEAFFHLCHKLNMMPTRIVMVDDKLSHLAAVEKAAQAHGVEFIGLRYSYADAHKALYNHVIADYQFRHSTFGHIISDDEAKLAVETP